MSTVRARSSVDGASGQEVVYTISNTRRTGPPVPPQPRPHPGLHPCPSPERGTAVPAVQKFVAARIGRLGASSPGRWSSPTRPMTSHRREDHGSRRPRSRRSSQGRPPGAWEIQLRSWAPSRRAGQVASSRTRMLIAGARLNSVSGRRTAGLDPRTTSPRSWSASARVHAPLQQRCSDVSINRRVALASRASPGCAWASNVFGRPLSGTVDARQRRRSASASARANASGVATMKRSLR